MATADLVKLAVAYGLPDQMAIIDALTRESGILRTMPFQKASHGLFHKYKTKSALPSGAFRQVNGSIIPHTTIDELHQEDLKILTDIQSEDKAICEAYPGGVVKYFADEGPAFVEGLGQSGSRQLVYGTDATFGNADGFVGLRQHAVAAGNIKAAGGTSGQRSTILVVRWKLGVCCGLYNENAFASGNIVTMKALGQGEPIMVVTDTTTGAQKPVYQMLYEAYLSLLVSVPGNVAAYTQVSTETGHTPTASNVNALIDMVKGDPADTYIYVNRTCRTLLGDLKDGKLKVGPGDSDYNTMITTWNGIRVVVDDNISNVETI